MSPPEPDAHSNDPIKTLPPRALECRLASSYLCIHPVTTSCYLSLSPPPHTGYSLVETLRPWQPTTTTRIRMSNGRPEISARTHVPSAESAHPIHWSPPEPAHPHRNVPKRNWQFLVTPTFYFIAPEPPSLSVAAQSSWSYTPSQSSSRAAVRRFSLFRSLVWCSAHTRRCPPRLALCVCVCFTFSFLTTGSLQSRQL